MPILFNCSSEGVQSKFHFSRNQFVSFKQVIFVDYHKPKDNSPPQFLH